MKLYKLTNKRMKTLDSFPYELGVEAKANSTKPAKLCTSGVLHAYVDPVLGLLLNPAHAAFRCPRVFEAEGVVVVDDGTKVGVRALTLTRQLCAVEVTTDHRVEFAIRCALEVYNAPEYKVWADGWISGDRTYADAVRYAAATRYADVVMNALRACPWYAEMFTEITQ
jgi:hypothetical protein